MRFFLMSFLLLFLLSSLNICIASSSDFKVRKFPLSACGDSSTSLVNTYRSKEDIFGEMKSIICSSSNFNEKLAVINKSIKKYPKEPVLYLERANLYYDKYRYNKSSEYLKYYNLAVDDLKTAIALDPDDVVLYTSLGELYFWEEDYPSANAMILQAKKIEKTPLNVGLGCAIELKLKDPNASLKKFKCTE